MSQQHKQLHETVLSLKLFRCYNGCAVFSFFCFVKTLHGVSLSVSVHVSLLLKGFQIALLSSLGSATVLFSVATVFFRRSPILIVFVINYFNRVFLCAWGCFVSCENELYK